MIAPPEASEIPDNLSPDSSDGSEESGPEAYRPEEYHEEFGADEQSRAESENGWRHKFSVAAFLQGLGMGAVLFALIYGGSLIGAGKTAEEMQARIPSQTVTIRAAGRPVAPQDGTHRTAAGQPAEQGQKTSPTQSSSAHPAPTGSSQTQPSAHATPSAAISLPAAPIDGLFVLRPDGSKLPIIRHSDNLTPFTAYRRPFARQETDKPIISLAIVDLGLSAAATESAIRAMPPEISLALSPYAATPDVWVTESRVRGHEVWLTLPVEGARYPTIDPGPHTLMLDVPASENEFKLSWIMSRATGYVGFIASSESPTFLTAHPGLRPALNNIYGRGLAFAEIGAPAGSPPEALALGAGAPYTTIDLVIDNVPAPDAIKAQLSALESLARERGAASGILRPLPVSYNKVLEWIETLPDKGFVLAPLSANAGY